MGEAMSGRGAGISGVAGMGDKVDPAVADAARLLLEHLAGARAPQVGPPMRDLWTSYWETEAKFLHAKDRAAIAWERLRGETGDDGIPLEDRPALTVSLELLEQIRSKLRSRPSGRYTTDGQPKLMSAATVNRHLVVLRRMFNWARETKRLPYNPISCVRMEPENNVKRTAIRTEAEFAKLLDACDARLRALCLVYFDGGLRRMEGLNLTRDQIERRPNGTAVVRLSAADTKGKYPRLPRLTKRAAEALDALPDRGPFFFARPDGKRPYHKRYIYRLFCEAVARSGLRAYPGERITIHTLRHSFAYTRRSIDHWPESRIMAAGGWKTRVAFDRYGIVDDSEMDRALDDVEERLTKVKK